MGKLEVLFLSRIQGSQGFPSQREIFWIRLERGNSSLSGCRNVRRNRARSNQSPRKYGHGHTSGPSGFHNPDGNEHNPNKCAWNYKREAYQRNAEIAYLKSNAPQRTARRLDPVGYYWMYGYKVVVRHSSGIYTQKRTGH